MRWRTAGLLLAMLIIVGLPYLVTLNNSKDTQSASEWVAHSLMIEALTYQITHEVHASEAATYRLLTGDHSQITRQRALHASGVVPKLIEQLHGMTRDNSDQQMLIGTLTSSVDGHIKMMDQAMDRLRQGDDAGARQALSDAEDLFSLDTQVTTIVASESRLLREREELAATRIREGRIVLTLTALAQIVLLIIIVVTSERQVGRRRLAETREGRAVLRSQMIVQAVREPIALFDADLKSLLVNPAFSELYGLDPAQGSQSLEQIGDGAWGDKALLQRLRDVLTRDRELWDFDVIQRTADDVERHVVVNARRLHQEDSESESVLLTVSDVTIRALAEQKVVELNRQLEGKVVQISDVNRELEAFSYSVSHDLRAPLRHIAGFARKLEKHLGEHVDDKAAHYLEVIGGSAERMAQLIDDLLVFSRLGRGALRLQAVDMQSVVEETRALVETAAHDRQITWKIAQLPMVICDQNMLRTVWQNLLGNAVKYTGQCDVAHIEVSVQQSNKGDYEFTVADNGAGFDMQYADKLFGVFQRLHKASEFPGNGIGLANVRRIIARHGGRVWAEAEAGQGARFHFSLPATELAGASNEK